MNRTPGQNMKQNPAIYNPEKYGPKIFTVLMKDSKLSWIFIKIQMNDLRC